MLALLFVLLPLLACGLNVDFAVRMSSSEKPVVQDLQTAIHEGQNPLKALRQICHENKIWRIECSRIIGDLFSSLSDKDRSEIHGCLGSYDDDIIVRSPGCTTVPFVWGKVQLDIDLSQLGAKKLCGTLLLPAYEYDVHRSVYAFCGEYSLTGLHCRELYYEVTNYLTSLYARPKGLTLQNLFTGMYFQEDLNYLYFHVDVRGSFGLKRFYFAQYRSYFVESICNFCIQHNLDREACTTFAEYVNTEMIAFYGEDSLELYSMLYAMRSINTIVATQSVLRLDINNVPEVINILRTDRALSHSESSTDFVDADFIEIGTSNFNTITQLIDDADHLVGFAIEPSLHYLHSLPNRTGVVKANCAIVSARDAAQGVKTVDFYYIPEDTIKRLHLGDFMMGCNSVGDYHGMQVKLGYQQHVVIEKVHAYSLESFLQLHNIRRIRLLKIDAEGYDVVIMEELYQYLVAKNDITLYPERILFETNDPDPVQKSIVQGLIEKFYLLGYALVMHDDDTILELSGLN